jgi:hypothetical protein
MGPAVGKSGGRKAMTQRRIEVALQRFDELSRTTVMQTNAVHF